MRRQRCSDSVTEVDIDRVAPAVVHQAEYSAPTSTRPSVGKANLWSWSGKKYKKCCGFSQSSRYSTKEQIERRYFQLRIAEARLHE